MAPPSADTGHPKTHRPLAVWWICAAFCAALGLAFAVLVLVGPDVRGTRIALRVTARFSFLLFWIAYAGRALAEVFGPSFQAVAARGRDFGLAFASAHLVHVGLIVWLYRISPDPPVSEAVFVFFGLGVVWTYVLALFSFKRPSRAIGSACLRIIRTVGVEYIAAAFSVDFVLGPLMNDLLQKQPKTILVYLPFSVLAVTGLALRLIALAERARHLQV